MVYCSQKQKRGQGNGNKEQRSGRREHKLMNRISGIFAGEGFVNAQKYMKGLLSDAERKNGWQIAENQGESTPYNLQQFIYRGMWSADRLRDEMRRYVSEELGEPEGVCNICVLRVSVIFLTDTPLFAFRFVLCNLLSFFSSYILSFQCFLVHYTQTISLAQQLKSSGCSSTSACSFSGSIFRHVLSNGRFDNSPVSALSFFHSQFFPLTDCVFS